MMIFGAIYRPTREVSTLGDGALLPARGALPGGDRADLRALRVRPADARGAARWPSGMKVHPGRQPPRLPRLRDRPRPLPGAPRLVEGMSASCVPARARASTPAGVAFALVLRRRPAACRWAAFLASARRLTGQLRARRVGARERPLASSGVLLRARRPPGSCVGYAVDAAVGVVPAWRSPCWRCRWPSTAWATWPTRSRPARTAFVGVGFNVLLGVGRDRVRRRRRHRLPVRLGADDARHGRARRDRAREPREPARRRISTSSCRTSGTGCLVAGVLHPGRGVGLARRSPTLLGGAAVAGADARRAVRPVPRRLRREGRRRSRCTSGCPRRTRRRRAASRRSCRRSSSTPGIYGLVRVCAFGLGVPTCGWGLALAAARARCPRSWACSTR